MLTAKAVAHYGLTQFELLLVKLIVKCSHCSPWKESSMQVTWLFLWSFEMGLKNYAVWLTADYLVGVILAHLEEFSFAIV